MIAHRSFVFALVALAVGCGSADGMGGSEDDVQGSAGKRVTGAKAERLMAAFGLLEADEHAMGGRASVDVSKLTCLTPSNNALDESEALRGVPITTCAFDIANAKPAHKEVTDAPATAGLLFDALTAVDESLGDSAMGKSFIVASKVECVGRGPSTGDDPEHPSPIVVGCTVTPEQGKAVAVDGEKAARLFQAFDLGDLSDRAMGGTLGVRASSIKCERSKNEALDESDPMFALPATTCTLQIDGMAGASTLTDAPKAVVLASALEGAGLAADTGAGTTGIVAARIKCSKGPNAPVSCKITP